MAWSGVTLTRGTAVGDGVDGSVRTVMRVRMMQAGNLVTLVAFLLEGLGWRGHVSDG